MCNPRPSGRSRDRRAAPGPGARSPADRSARTGRGSSRGRRRRRARRGTARPRHRAQRGASCSRRAVLPNVRVMPSETLRVGRRAVELSSPDKLLFARAKVTKRDLARHYERVAGAMLPHVRDRPLSLQVFPRGVDAPGHFMKSVPAHFPQWIAKAEVAKRGGTLTQVLANDAATLVYLAGQNAITPHVWLSRVDEPRRPDRLIIDFDPSPGVGFAAVRAAARDVGDRLRDAGLVPFAMVTGSR